MISWDWPYTIGGEIEMEIPSGRGCCFGMIDVEREPSRPSVETLSRLSSLVRLAAEMEILPE